MTEFGSVTLEGAVAYAALSGVDSTEDGVRSALSVARNGQAAYVTYPELTDADTPPVEAPQIVGGVQYATSLSSGTVAVTAPAGIQAGDLVVIAVRNHSAGAQPTSPGFANLGPAYDEQITSVRRRMVFLGKLIPAGGETETSYVVTLPGGGRTVAMAFIVRGVPSLDYVAGFSSPYGGRSVYNGTGALIGAETYEFASPVAPVLVLGFFGGEFTAGNGHEPVSTPALYDLVFSAETSTDLLTTRTFAWVGARAFMTESIPSATMAWGAPSNPGATALALRGSQVSGEGMMPTDLIEALYRRVVHAIALRTLPLGFQVSIGGDGGIPIRVGGPDREVTRLETPYRRRFVG